MRVLSDWELVGLWERALPLDDASRAIELLSAACPDETREALERLPVGRRDVRLLRLREMIFGPDVRAVAQCPACDERVELSFRADQFAAPPPSAGGPESPAGHPPDAVDGAGELVAVSADGYEVVARPPDTRALAAVASAASSGGPAAARETLLASCVVRSTRGGEPVPAGSLPAHVVARVARALEERDPQADVRMQLRCPACGREWEERFDPVPFLWVELGAWTTRVLREVHALAGYYGWRERDILEMSAARRQLYLGMTGG